MFPTSPVAFWHYFDFITVGAITIVIMGLVRAHHKKTGGLLGSISETLAYSKTSSTIFSIVMTIFFPLYYAFIWFWILPLIHAPRVFYYLLIVPTLCEIVFIWVPATVGRSKRIHKVMVGIVFIIMYVFALLILIHGIHINMAARIGLSIYLASPFILFAAMTVKSLRKYTFLYEIIYCAAFLAAISLIGHGQ
jgi:hypothetical protein